LAYLKRYDPPALKVDGSFVAGMGASAEDDAIVASIIKLAGAVAAACIAERVETHEQHASSRDRPARTDLGTAEAR
jgi:diguanylate cyclase